MQISTIGLDIAKNVFQVHGIDAAENVVVRKQLRRGQVIAFFEALPPCLIGMEACATSHYWARELAKLGHEVQLMPAKDVKAYIKRNKNDAADAEAICEAVRRPTMRFVQVKSAEQQAQLMQHRARDLLMHQRTQLINAMRSHLAELGIIAPQGREGVKELLAIISNEDNKHLPNDARASLIVLAAQLQALQTTIGAIEKRIVVQHRANKESKRLQTVPGIGVIGASAIAATVTNPKIFRSGRLCSLDRAGATTNVDRGEAEARTDLQTGRPLPAAHPGGRRGFCPAPGEASSREVSLDHPDAVAAAIQGCRCCAGQQNGPPRLGADDER
jgi:transposase